MRPGRIAWTPEQDARLVRLYPVVSVAELAAHFGRSTNAIICRAHALKIRSGKIGRPPRSDVRPRAVEVLWMGVPDRSVPLRWTL